MEISASSSVLVLPPQAARLVKIAKEREVRKVRAVNILGNPHINGMLCLELLANANIEL